MSEVEISKVEMIWNETQMFARDLLAPELLDRNWADIPQNIRDAFASLVGEDIPREAFE